MARIFYENRIWGAAYVEHRGKDPFLKLFSIGVVNQESCFTCLFRNKSSADIRLGDYWGNRFKDNEEGVSIVIVNSSCGQEMLDAICSTITITKQNRSIWSATHRLRIP